MSQAADPKECRPMRENYFECLHHKKEFTELNNQGLSGEKGGAGGGAGSGDGDGGGH